MKFLQHLIITICIVTLYGCAGKVANINHSENKYSAVKKVTDLSPKLCSYRGKINVTFKNSGGNLSFGALINKKCNNEIFVNILGALNTPIATIIYENNKLSVKTSSKEDSQALKMLADNYIFYIINFIKTPLILPKDNFKLSFTKNAYVFSDDSHTIYTDEFFRIFKYRYSDININYLWNDDNFLKEITMMSPEGYISIKFLSPKGWGSK